MKMTRFVLVGLTVFHLASAASRAAWLDNAWRHRMPVTVNANPVGATLTNFTVLVTYSGASETLWSQAQNGGVDIVFTGADGTTRLGGEIERFDPVTSQLWAWVRIPLLDAGASTNLYMYYGNSAASYVDPNGAWDSDYLGVWHLSESATNDAPLRPEVRDSSDNNNDGDAHMTPESNMAVDGVIAGAMSFDGVDDQIDCGDACNLGTDDFTIHFWARFPTGQNENVLGRWETSDDRWYIRRRDSGDIQVYAKSDGGTTTWLNFFNSSFDTEEDQWYHIVVVGVRGVEGRIYIDGELNYNGGTCTTDNGDNAGSFTMGQAGVGEGGDYGECWLDEVRVSRVARTAEWISTCYSNQVNPAAFASFGAAEPAPGRNPNEYVWGGSLFGWDYRQRLVLDHNKVYGSHTDFPILVTEDALLANVWTHAQTDGDDLVFTASDGETRLSHEIERYDPVGQEAAIWVKMPRISETSNTVVFLYYGNGSAPNQEDPDNVWDSNFQAVYHLSETNNVAGNDVFDSTANNNDGEANVTPVDGMNVDGVIAGGIDFDGVDDEINMGDVLDLGSDDFTISFWGRFPTGAQSQVMGKLESSDDRWYVRQRFRDSGNDGIPPFEHYMNMYGVSGGVQIFDLYDAEFEIAHQQWYHVTVIGDRGTESFVYMDAVAGVPDPCPAANSVVAGDFTLGKADGIFGDSVLDEVRISNIIRSQDWVRMEYYNQLLPAMFFTNLETQEVPQLGTVIMIR